MKSNNPIIKNIDGVDVLLDRLCVDMCVSSAPGNGKIKQSIIVKIKRCSIDGFIDDEAVKTYIYGDIMSCRDMNVLTAFGEIDAVMTELINKEGL